MLMKSEKQKLSEQEKAQKKLEKIEKKLEKIATKRLKATKETLQKFLEHFNVAWYSLKEPVRELEKFFNIYSKGWTVYIYLKTKEWEMSMWQTNDIDLADLQNVINYLKVKAEVYLLRHEDD